MICRQEEVSSHCYGNKIGGQAGAATGAAPTGVTRVNNSNGSSGSGNNTQNNNINDTLDMHSQCKNVPRRKQYQPAREYGLARETSNCKCRCTLLQETARHKQQERRHPPLLLPGRQLTISSAIMSIPSPLGQSKSNHESKHLTEPFNAPFNCNNNGTNGGTSTEPLAPYVLRPVTFRLANLPHPASRSNCDGKVILREKPLIIPLKGSPCHEEPLGDPRLAKRSHRNTGHLTLLHLDNCSSHAAAKCPNAHIASSPGTCVPCQTDESIMEEEAMEKNVTSRCGISAHDPRLNRCKRNKCINMGITSNSNLSNCNTNNVQKHCSGFCKHGNSATHSSAIICHSPSSSPSPSPLLAVSPPPLPIGYIEDAKGDLDIITAAINDIDERRVNMSKCVVEEATAKATTEATDGACDEARTAPPGPSPFAATAAVDHAKRAGHSHDYDHDHSHLVDPLTPALTPPIKPTASPLRGLSSFATSPATNAAPVTVVLTTLTTTSVSKESLPTPPPTPTTASLCMPMDPLSNLDCAHLPITPVPTGGKRNLNSLRRIQGNEQQHDSHSLYQQPHKTLVFDDHNNNKVTNVPINHRLRGQLKDMDAVIKCPILAGSESKCALEKVSVGKHNSNKPLDLSSRRRSSMEAPAPPGSTSVSACGENLNTCHSNAATVTVAMGAGEERKSFCNRLETSKDSLTLNTLHQRRDLGTNSGEKGEDKSIRGASPSRALTASPRVTLASACKSKGVTLTTSKASSTLVKSRKVQSGLPPHDTKCIPPTNGAAGKKEKSSSRQSPSKSRSRRATAPATVPEVVPVPVAPQVSLTDGEQDLPVSRLASCPVTLAPTPMRELDNAPVAEIKCNSPPPSPLRLSLPSYSQSYESPYPDYCIVRRAMSPSNQPPQPLRPLHRSSGCQYRRTSPSPSLETRGRSRSRSPCALAQQQHRQLVYSSPPHRKGVHSPRKHRNGSFTSSRRSCKSQYECEGSSAPLAKKGRRIVAVCCENHEMSLSSSSSSSSSASSSPSHPQASAASLESPNPTNNHSSPSLSSKQLPQCTGSKVNYTTITNTSASASKAISNGKDLHSHQAGNGEGHGSSGNVLRSPSPHVSDEKHLKSTRNASGLVSPSPSSSPSPSTSSPPHIFGCSCLHSRSNSLEPLDHMAYSPPPHPAHPSTSTSASSFGDMGHSGDRAHRYHERSHPYDRQHSRRAHQGSFSPSPPPPVRTVARRSPNLISRKASNFAPAPHHPPLRSPDIDERVTRTLHIGRLCPSVDKDELRDLFTSLGGHIMSVFVKPPLPTGQPTFAFVKFVNLIEAYHAKNKFHLYQLGNTKILTAYGRINPTNRVWLGNLDPSVETQFLYSELDRYGTIVKMAHYKARGEAVVHFETVSGAEEARNRLRGTSIKDLMAGTYIAKDEAPNQSLFESLAPKKSCDYSREVNLTRGERSPGHWDCGNAETGDEVVVVTCDKDKGLLLCRMTPSQLQERHPTLWHKGNDYFKCLSATCATSSSSSSSCDCGGHENKFSIPDDEDFTKVKKGVTVTDFVDEMCSKSIDSDSNCDSYSSYSG